MQKILTRLTEPRNFFLFILGFSLFGLLMIYNVSVADSLTTFGNSWHFASRHAMWMVLGFSLFGLCFAIPTAVWKQLAPLVFVGGIVLLIAVLIPGIGVKVMGAQRWIAIGGFTLQPSEVMKLALILFFASWLERHQRFGPFILFTSLIFLLILLQPNLSTASIIVVLATLMFFFAGGNIKPLLIFGCLGGLMIALLVLSAPYRRERLMTFLNPSSDSLGRSYHIRQVTIALGRGGLVGQGIGLSKQKQQYIPEASSDSIFAIYAEETGFLGSLALLSAYGVLIAMGYTVAAQQTEPFAFLVAAGVSTWISLHTLLNICAMVALVPLTGIPLPLISSGGSSYVSMMAGLGILVGLQHHRKNSDKQPSRRPHNRLPRSRAARIAARH